VAGGGWVGRRRAGGGVSVVGEVVGGGGLRWVWVVFGLREVKGRRCGVGGCTAEGENEGKKGEK
jgi:hypothetical protein